MQRRGRLILGGITLLVAVLVACVWLIPGLLDWNRYRDGIAALASQQLGRPVHIGGAVSLQLLPQPILTAADVSVEGGSVEGGSVGGGLADEHGVAVGEGVGPDGIGLRAKALRLRVALGALLAGKVDARELTLQGADLRLPWPPPPGALAQRPPSWLTGLQARVEDGRLQVGELVFTGIEGTVTTDPDTGTLAVAGVLQAGLLQGGVQAGGVQGAGVQGAGTGRPRWQFTGRLGRPGGDGAAGLDVSLDGQDRLRDTGGTFSGQIGADGALSGRVAARGPDLSQLMPAPALPWRMDGQLNAAGGLAIADELALEIGGAPATGAVALRVQPTAQLDVSITAGRLDLDAWLPALLSHSGGSLRAGIPTGVDLSAEAATLAGGVVRRLRAGVDVTGGVMHLRDVTAILPGEAQLRLSGQVASEPQTRFDGTARLQAPNLRTTLRWLQRALPARAAAAVEALPPAVLHSADLSARVTAEAGQGAASEIAGQVDEGRVSGSASFHIGARAGVTIALAVDRLRLDPWLPDPAMLAQAVPGRAVAGGAETLQAVLPALRSVDAQVKLQAGQASWRGMTLGAVAVEFESEVSRVALRRLEAQPLGARLSLSGQVGDGGRISDGRLDVSAPELGQLRPLLAELRTDHRLSLAPAYEALLRGPGSLLVLAAGPPEAIAGRVTLELGDLRVESQPVVNLLSRHWAGPVTLHHPGAPRLLETLGVSGTAAWLGDGSFSLVGQADVLPGRVEVNGATLAAGSLRASGKVVLEGRRAFGTVAFETLPLPLVYPRSPDPLPVGWLHGWEAGLRVEAGQVLVGLTPVLERASADVTLEHGVLSVGRGTAQVQGGTLTAEGVLDASADPPRVTAQAQLAGLDLSGLAFDVPVDVVAGQMEASGSLAAAGYSPGALLATVQGQAAVRVHGGVVSGFDLTAAGAALALPDAQQALRAAGTALLAGNTSFTSLGGPVTVAQGAATVDLVLTSPAGAVRLAGSVDLEGGGLDLGLTFKPVVAEAPGGGERLGPSLGERLTGQAGSAVRTPELAGLARWLADRP